MSPNSFLLPGLLVLLALGQCRCQQLPLVASDSDDWDLRTPPNPNTTGHLVFDTVSSLLVHWPNTNYHNGHTIVPGTIPTGMLLYHGRNDPDAPTAREWVSTDPEFARLFCVEPTDCWLLTVVTTRPLRILYFDGSSATKMPDGPMDSQDLLIWGEVLPERATPEWEYERLHNLCDNFEFDGILRMQLNFELMLCSFTDGVTTQSLVRLEDEERFPHYAYGFLDSSRWNDDFPGLSRIHLDLTRLISLYDTSLAPSLIPFRYGKSRRAHRVLGIDDRDTQAVLASVRALSSTHPPGSGIDWRNMFQSIRDRYAIRLEVLHDVLAEDDSSMQQRAFRIIQMLLLPYRLHNAVPSSSDSADEMWAAPVFRLCAAAHTSFAESDSVRAKFTASEHLLLAAVRETHKEICRTLVGMWADGVVYNTASKSTSDETELVRRWRREVQRLMEWLGWSEWVKCRPACVFPESCYYPGAPFSMEEWNSTTPRCVRLFEPYAGIPEEYIIDSI
ncbi:J domain-containing protein [Favolaschia claudopus]|uniref:J domain-containing protein n=1 Tax=Favolaschia claudopus TaxID=2862362 RepID=A0AAW0B0X3_9AGAR